MAALAVIVLWSVGGAPAPSRVHRCADAIVVAGQLHCGPARAAALRAQCPALAMPRPGTAVDGECQTRADAALMRALQLPVDINAASGAALQSLPGVGPVLAERIIVARPFTGVADLRRVKGIGPAKLRAIAPRVQLVSHL